MSDLLDALHRVGEKKLLGLRRSQSYRASLSIAAGACGKPLVDASLPPPTSRYDSRWSFSDLSVFRTGVKRK